MNPKKIRWEDGLKLDSKILSESDLLGNNYSETCNYLPFNLSKGIVTFNIDVDSLTSGLILVKKLEIYLDNKKFVYFDNSYPLSIKIINDEIAATIPIYLNINETVIEKDQTKYLTDIISLSTEYNHTADFSVKIAAFRSNNSILEPLEYDFPIITMDHYLMDLILLRLNKLISNIESYNKFVFSVSNPHAAIFLRHLIHKFKRELIFAGFNKSNAYPYHIFNSLNDIYSYIGLNSSALKTNIIHYNFRQAYSSFDALIKEAEIACQQQGIKNFVQFKLVGRKYVCDKFPQEFFTANKYYFVVKEKPGINSLLDNLDRYIRITSISRYTNAVVLSLSGLKLSPINSKMHKNFDISLAKTDFLFEIEQNAEWDFIMIDKTATFSSFDNSENYEYFIAFI